MGLNAEAANIEQAIFKTIAAGQVRLHIISHANLNAQLTILQYITGDLGGKAKTYEYTDAVIKALN